MLYILLYGIGCLYKSKIKHGRMYVSQTDIIFYRAEEKVAYSEEDCSFEVMIDEIAFAN